MGLYSRSSLITLGIPFVEVRWRVRAKQWYSIVNTLRPRQNGRHFADDIFKRIFVNENILILIKISLKFVPKGAINSIPALVQIMAWCRPGDKPLSEPMTVNLPTLICVTRPQWVNSLWPSDAIWWQRSGSVNTDSSNGLLPDGTKPLPEPISTNHQWGLVPFSWGQSYKKRSNYMSLIRIWKWII